MVVKYSMKEIIDKFTDPDALKKTRKMWNDAEPKTMRDLKIPMLPLSKID